LPLRKPVLAVESVWDYFSPRHSELRRVIEKSYMAYKHAVGDKVKALEEG
jgi:hypothetical protein